MYQPRYVLVSSGYSGMHGSDACVVGVRYSCACLQIGDMLMEAS